MNWNVYRDCKRQWTAMVASGDMTEEHYFLALEAILSYELGVAWTEGTAMSGISFEMQSVRSASVKAQMKPVFTRVYDEWLAKEVAAGRVKLD